MTLCINPAFAEESRHFPAGTRDVYISDQAGIRPDLLGNIAPMVEKSIADGYYPGAVVLVGHRGQVIYRGVFGNQSITPKITPMRLETIFDLASLTKVIVTTTAVMQLVEAGKLDLDATVASYWPAFANKGKENVTVRELLTHTAGFPPVLSPWTPPADKNQRYAVGLQQVEQLGLVNPPGKVFTYSDISFISLGHLVEIISGEPIAQYAQTHIFQPLKMASTTYLPPSSWDTKIAPTSSPEDQQPRLGQVNDPPTERMGGANGMAGVFSNAPDLGIFLQCLLDGGRISGNRYLLGPLTILKMSTPQSPSGILDKRGLGWDMDSVFTNRGVLIPASAFGHTGWTGTSILIDPATQTWIIMLTSRSHPSLAPKNQVMQDRRAIANIVAGSLIDVNTTNLNLTSPGELQRAYSPKDAATQ